MQKRNSEVMGDRPACAADPQHRVHRHGRYERYANANDSLKVGIARFLCIVCGRTLSVLPETMLPYRAVSVAQVERAFDARAADHPPPPTTEKERGCLNRAWTRFEQHVSRLTTVLGQIIRPVRPTAAILWQELRRHSNLAGILRQLSRTFHTSLLGDYACLRPWSASTE
jgi:hypothetical protein